MGGPSHGLNRSSNDGHYIGSTVCRIQASLRNSCRKAVKSQAVQSWSILTA